jgi:predicted alpha/beta hydrolase family esterase
LAAADVDRRTVLCHSLSCLLWLHGVERGLVSELPAPVDRVLLVAPPSGAFLRENTEITAFLAPAVAPDRLSAAAGHTRLVASDDDPYCEQGAQKEYGGTLGLPTDVLPGTAHLNPDSGYGPWPRMLEWCLEEGDGSRGLSVGS